MDRNFLNYAAIGVLNTAIHWAIFFCMIKFIHADQAFINFVAFCIAVTFSFFANTALNFKSTATTIRYAMYVGFMGFISILAGMVADIHAIKPWITLITFSIISLSCGYFYYKHIVFKVKNSI